jgi:DNA-binding NarL/FixJ family response regulator
MPGLRIGKEPQKPMKMRLLITGGQSPTRSALRLFLHEGRGFQVVGEAADSEELLAEVRSKHPNVVLLEWELPGQPTIDFLPRLRGVNSRMSVIVFSGRPELEEAARTAGADLFFSLGDPPKRLLAALQAFDGEKGLEA